jgi:hypothetical protein
LDINELLDELKKEKIPPEWYLIGRKGIADCTTCLDVIDGKWAVYFYERGNRENLTFHESISEACEELLAQMKETKRLLGME